MRPPWSRHWLFWPVAVVGFLVDLVSKEVVFAVVGEPSTHGQANSLAVIPDVFHLTTSLNHGVLWGFGSGLGGLWAVPAAFAALGIIVWVCFYLADDQRWSTVALAFIEAGALGNVLDRVLYGAVRDFLDVRFIRWPVFNAADTWLVVGALMIVLQMLWTHPEPEAQAAGRARPNGRTS